MSAPKLQKVVIHRVVAAIPFHKDFCENIKHIILINFIDRKAPGFFAANAANLDIVITPHEILELFETIFCAFAYF